MFIIKSRVPLSIEQAKRLQAMVENAKAHGETLVLGPEFDVMEIDYKDLAFYEAQLGDA